MEESIEDNNVRDNVGKPKRYKRMPGDVFEIAVSKTEKIYFQRIMSDPNILGADIVRIFEKKYPLDASPAVWQIVSDESRFYTHTFVLWGVKLNLWTFVGRSKHVNMLDMKNIVFGLEPDRDMNKGFNNMMMFRVWRPGDTELTFRRLSEKERHRVLTGIAFGPLAFKIWLQRLDDWKYEGRKSPDYRWREGISFPVIKWKNTDFVISNDSGQVSKKGLRQWLQEKLRL